MRNPPSFARIFIFTVWLTSLILLAASCSTSMRMASPTPGAPTGGSILHTAVPQASEVPTLTPAPSSPPTGTAQPGSLTDAETTTLSSLKKVDGYPLYTMHYSAPFDLETLHSATISPLDRVGSESTSHRPPANPWACSLFAALGDPENSLYGRNFDWEYSPALLLFKDSPGAYASVSMVDLAYFGFSGDQAINLLKLPLEERRPLLRTPSMPFDGMNEHGLVVAMAAVQLEVMTFDPDKETIDSIGVMREMLDRALDVDEALDILGRYNIRMNGPALHYLLADRSGKAVLVEFYKGVMHVIPNLQPWHIATNFITASVEGDPAGTCWRYDTISRRLDQTGGKPSIQEALDLLAQVSQDITQWSVVYDMSNRAVNVVVGRQYDSQPHVFQLGK
jgi:hypothetical protein